jgi:lysophospholipase L1-like esterase
MRVLIFGDSITQGFWDTEGGWVSRLRKYYNELQVQALHKRDDPVIFSLGVSADMSDDILKRVEAETKVRTRHNDLPAVVVQVGTNDSSTEDGKARIPLKIYAENLSHY